MADVQILAPGVEDAPLDYLVPGSSEILLKAAFAVFDGSGAAGAFLPALRIVAPSGKVVGEYVTDSTVAAGSSAEVSFAPFLRNAATGATPVTTNLPWCRVRMFNNLADQTITSGPIQNMKFNDSFNSDATVFTPSTGVVNQIKVLKSGLYSIRARMFWNTTPTVAMIALNGIDTDAWAPYAVTADFQNVTETGFVATLARLQANQIIFVTVRQASGVNKALYGQGGNFLEMQRVGDTTTEDLAGGP